MPGDFCLIGVHQQVHVTHGTFGEAPVGTVGQPSALQQDHLEACIHQRSQRLQKTLLQVQRVEVRHHRQPFPAERDLIRYRLRGHRVKAPPYHASRPLPFGKPGHLAPVQRLPHRCGNRRVVGGTASREQEQTRFWTQQALE